MSPSVLPQTPDKQGDRLGVLLLFNLQPCPVPTNPLWESSCLQALRSSSKSPLTPGKGQPAGWATFQQTSLVQKMSPRKVLAVPHGGDWSTSDVWSGIKGRAEDTENPTKHRV